RRAQPRRSDAVRRGARPAPHIGRSPDVAPAGAPDTGPRPPAKEQAVSSTSTSTTLAGRSAGELRDLVAAREVSCREVVEAHLQRIGAVNDDVNALRLVLADDARAAADAADRRIAAGEPARALEGVPSSAK